MYAAAAYAPTPPTAATVRLKKKKDCLYIRIPPSASATTTRKPYQGLIPSKSTSITPVAGYHTTEPSREIRMTSGRLRKRYTSTKESERMRWRTMGCLNIGRIRSFLLDISE